MANIKDIFKFREKKRENAVWDYSPFRTRYSKHLYDEMREQFILLPIWDIYAVVKVTIHDSLHNNH